MIRVEVRVSGMDEALRHVKRVRDRLENEREDGLSKAVQELAKVFDENFQSEGGKVGGWKPLADATIRRREYYGYPGEHPIMIRYSALRGVVAEDMKPGKPGRFSRSDNYSGHVTQGSLDIDTDTAILTAKGWKVSNQYGFKNKYGSKTPARPFWFTNKHAVRAAKDGVVMWIVDEVVK